MSKDNLIAKFSDDQEVGVLDTENMPCGKALKLTPDPGDELVDWFESGLAKKLEAEATPGDGVWVYRTNRRWTQAQLGAKLGVSAVFVSDMEAVAGR